MNKIIRDNNLKVFYLQKIMQEVRIIKQASPPKMAATVRLDGAFGSARINIYTKIQSSFYIM